MPLAPYSSCYIFENELHAFGLPSDSECPGIMDSVQMASSIIDTECGRIDGDGGGTLAYCTYVQRILLQTRNRNLIVLTEKPIVGVTQATIDELQLAASGQTVNGLYTGLTANTIIGFGGRLSGILGASGRYGYTRQDRSIAYPDLAALINPLNLVTLFGGPAPWVPLDISNMDYDRQTGEVWVPAGLQLQAYSEVVITYNAGYDPRVYPRAIKSVCASIVKNALLKGDGITGLLQMSVPGAASTQMHPNLLDPTLDAMLQPFRTVRAY